MTKISLVMATINRVDEISVFLQHLIKQSFREFELIIVDQSSDLVHESLKSLINNKIYNSLSIKLIHTNLPGLSRARNIGLKYANNDIIGFPDDDCWYSENVLLNTINLLKNPQLYFISGQYTEPGKSNPKFPHCNLKIDGYASASIPSSVGLFVKKSVIDAGILFDENLGAGTSMPIGEETDFVLSMIDKNFFGFYYHEHIIFHKIQNITKVSYNVILRRETARGYIFGKRASKLKAIFWSMLGLIKLLCKMNSIFVLRARIIGIYRGWKYFLSVKKSGVCRD